tara:strand:- start:831 stop:1109 length:279 start_codon:yes stop_codon:yes gene_type:complete
MAFSIDGWGVIGASKKGVAPSLYSYATTEAVADVNTEGYFNDLSDTLAVGDLIIVRSSTGGTQVVSLNYVLTNASGVVDVTDGTVLANTDSD